jgi:hypothetical protein
LSGRGPKRNIAGKGREKEEISGEMKGKRKIKIKIKRRENGSGDDGSNHGEEAKGGDATRATSVFGGNLGVKGASEKSGHARKRGERQ